MRDEEGFSLKNMYIGSNYFMHDMESIIRRKISWFLDRREIGSGNKFLAWTLYDDLSENKYSTIPTHARTVNKRLDE